MKPVCEKALKEEYLYNASQAESFVEEAEKVHLEQLEYLKEVLNKAAEADMHTEICMSAIKTKRSIRAPTAARPETSLSSSESSSSSSPSDEELFRRQIELLHEYGKIMIEMGEA
ncbi:hypothetical protein GIB67_018206 [Kingdonia uniflora]|uniref:Uncharacterized protein n=1 Tax=Kingdonia uniflora TaxID=39325 RepID=A0A7J7NMK0_9MAGN|nr:hypothetical protein GIB67_018206 [Kingdonia uniflora]